MRIFQNSGVYRSYRPRLARLTKDCATFAQATAAFLDDRFGAAHFLQPVLNGDKTAFFANGDDETTQRLWASENGLPTSASLSDILRAQIEHHRTEVFYNMDPMRYGDAFLATLPGHVKRTIAWRAAPSAGGRFLKHDVIVNNFPLLLSEYRAQGARAEYFTPAHDPAMDHYAQRTVRPIDVLFVGTYSQYHRQRAAMLEAIAALRHEVSVVMHLDQSRLSKLAETPLGLIGPLRRERRPADIRRVSKSPVFGRDLLDVISRSKIVINGAIDMAGRDRGNMRVWEALGCGAALISDSGNYPAEMINGKHFITYDNPNDAIELLIKLLNEEEIRGNISSAGHMMIAECFSKIKQWERFQEIAA